VSGAATDLALRIRRHNEVSWPRFERFAEAASIDLLELRAMVAPAMERAGVIDVIPGPHGEPTAIEEHVGVAAPVLEQAARIWDQCSPRPVEACAIEAADHSAYRPLLQSDLQSILEAAGFAPSLHADAFAALRSIGLLRRDHSDRLREDVLYSPHVWGTEAIQIAEFISGLPPNERDVLATLTRVAADRPGSALEDFGVDNRLLRTARKVGLVDAARVLTSSGEERAFGFPPGLERRFGPGSTDATHERKLFVAHIMFGHRYGYPGTGRIRDPLVLVEALLSRGQVGPASAIATDYPLLEGQGIVRVEETSGGRGYLHLVKDDVARESLELLRLALGEDRVTGATGADPFSSLWVPGAAVRLPEQDRNALPEPEPGAEAEALRSTIDHLREETARQMREEEM
jgi:hypothetical protein